MSNRFLPACGLFLALITWNTLPSGAQEAAPAAVSQAQQEKSDSASAANKEVSPPAAADNGSADKKEPVPPAGGSDKPSAPSQGEQDAKAGASEAEAVDKGQEAEKSQEEKEAKAAKKLVPRIKIAAGLSETGVSGGLLATAGPSLLKTLQKLNKIAKDEKVAAVWLEIRADEMGPAVVHELREAIARIKKAGKHVVADLRQSSTGGYLLASACHEIVVTPQGGLMIPGLRAEVMFYKGLFDKLGVRADFLQVGDYKGAGEPYSREKMSPALREELDSLLSDRFDQVLELIAADRGLSKDRVRELVDEGLFTSKKAAEVGLVDFVGYDERIEQRIKKAINHDELEISTTYGQKKVDTDFSGMGGFFKLMDLMAGVEPKKKSSKGKKIAIIQAVGSIVDADGGAGSLTSGELITPDAMIKAFHKAETDSKVVAIVLRIDSPGGSALASDLIWKAVSEAKKPVIASMGDVAASGGYYIAMGADEVFAAPGTTTGSIGVVGGKIALGGLYEKLGLNVEVISKGAKSGIFSELTSFSEEERKVWQANMDDVYEQFVSKAAQGRSLSVEQVRQVAQGRIWTGRQALSHKLVSKIGGLQDAIDRAKEIVGLSTQDEVELLVLPEPANIFEQLFGMEDVATQINASAAFGINEPELVRLYNEAFRLQGLFQRKVALVLPFELKISW